MKLYPLAYEVKMEGRSETHIEFFTSEVKCKKARADINRQIALKLKRIGRFVTVYPIEIPLKKEGVLKMGWFTASVVREGLTWVQELMMACDAEGRDTL